MVKVIDYKALVYEALPLFALYNNQIDTSLFIRLLLNDEFSDKGRTIKIYVRKSIINFPHSSYYPILKQQLLAEIGTKIIYEEFESYPLYEALVQYPSNEIKKLFESSLKNSGHEF